MEKKDVTPTRLEAFSDGVLAIIITIMVLELKAPIGSDWRALSEVWPVLVSYTLSYLMVAVYWINHHLLFHYVRRVDTMILWANIFLLFCLSFIPVTTAYMGENHMTPFATAIYAAVLMMCGFAFLLLRIAIGRHFGGDLEMLALKNAAGRKNLIALVLYCAAIPIAYASPLVSLLLIFVVGGLYAVPTALMPKKVSEYFE